MAVCSLMMAGAAVFGPTAISAAPAKSVLPVLTSLKPAAGPVGSTVDVIGTGLYSANRVVVAWFGTRGAPTRCPTNKLCIVTVPSRISGSVAVRIHTETGWSNALTFRVS
jgi:hypothetical protein